MAQARVTPIRDLIISLMSDGKPRTLTDVCNALNRHTRSLRAATGSVLKTLTKENILVCSSWHRVAVWELSEESTSHGPS